MNHLGLYTLHNMAPALTAATATECDKKKIIIKKNKVAMPVTELLNT